MELRKLSHWNERIIPVIRIFRISAVIVTLAACAQTPPQAPSSSAEPPTVPSGEPAYPKLILGKGLSRAEFRFEQGKLRCITERAADGVGRPDDPFPEYACLNIAGITVGATDGDVSRVAGVPGSSLTMRYLGRIDYIYRIPQFQPEFPNFTGTTPYLKIDYLNDRALAVQLSGPTLRRGAMTFSGLNLGDSADAVRRQLGEPTTIKPFGSTLSVPGPSEEWFYAPHSFSLLVSAGQLRSIRVYIPWRRS